MGMMNMLMGAGGEPIISLPPTLTAAGVGGGGFTSTIAFANTGGYTATGAGGGTWLTAGVAGACEIRLTVTGGAVNGTSDATATWLSLGTSRQWERVQTGVGTSQWTGTIEIRSAATLAVLATTNVGGVTCQATGI